MSNKTSDRKNTYQKPHQKKKVLFLRDSVAGLRSF
jgi:hypothetical protein